jgi:uncharacterized protein (AIM24 family)
MIELKGSQGAISIEITNNDTLIIKNAKAPIVNGQSRQGRGICNWLGAPIGRLVHGLYFCRYVTNVGKSTSVQLSTFGGKKLVHFYLPEHRQIVINLEFLVAFTFGTKIHTFGNFSIPAFACDRNILSLFEGPGHIVLETSGNHINHSKGDVSFEPQSLVAWDPLLEFKLDHVNGASDLYGNPTRMFCSFDSGEHDLIIDNGVEHHQVPGLVGYLKKAISWVIPTIG